MTPTAAASFLLCASILGRHFDICMVDDCLDCATWDNLLKIMRDDVPLDDPMFGDPYRDDVIEYKDGARD